MRNTEDIYKIKELINSLCETNPSVDKNIPKYLYHFSDIENIVGILKDGYLYSRNFAIQNGLMKNDNANQEVIGITDDQHKNFVRLYFRPKTPTQYHNEGVKSDYKTYEGAGHCPVPVFLLFSGEKMLSRKETKFVEKNLALRPLIKDQIDDLVKFDFAKIYHNGPIGGDRDIIEKRHAEVLIYEKCDLKNLEIIACRSSAEKETLRNVLMDNNIDVTNFTFLIDGRSILFNKSRAYIDYVELESEYFKIGFTNFTTLTANDKVLIQVKDDENMTMKEFSPSDCTNGKRFNMRKRDWYELSIFVNEKCIYLGRYLRQDNIPF